MSFPSTFDELNALYKQVRPEGPDLDRAYSKLRYPRGQARKRYRSLQPSALTGVGIYSQSANGGLGGFEFNE